MIQGTPAWGRNVVLFDYADPDNPSIYLTQDPVDPLFLPLRDSGYLPLSPDEYDKMLSAHFQRARDKNRFMTTALKNETVEVYVLVRGSTASRSVSIQDMLEESRDIRVARQVQGLPSQGLSPAPEREPPLYFVHKEFPLQFMRGNVTLQVLAVGRDTTAQVITGPQEDVFLGVDLPIDYFNLQGQALSLDQQPKEFYLSVDYIPLGDAYIKDLQPVVHLFTKVSESPFDSIGIGVGARLPDMWGFMDLSNVTVTMNLLRTQGNGTQDFQWVCQVGYNLFSVFPGWFR